MYKLTQQQRLLQELKKGRVNSYFATYELRIKQAPTRIKELKELGYAIQSIQKTDRSVDWEVVGESPKPKPKEYIFTDNGVAIEL